MNNTNPGGRNLTLLGAGAILITALTTGLSLFVYWRSGDIYLDRSRPGYLPDEDEASEEAETTDFEYSDTGPIDKDELERYLEEYKKLNRRLKDFSDPYSAAPLSDESLGIPTDETEENHEPES